MIVEFLGLVTEFGYLAADEPKEAFVNGLYISFIAQRFRYPRIWLEVRRIEFGIQLMQDVAKSYSIGQPFERLSIAIKVEDSIDLRRDYISIPWLLHNVHSNRNIVGFASTDSFQECRLGTLVVSRHFARHVIWKMLIDVRDARYSYQFKAIA